MSKYLSEIIIIKNVSAQGVYLCNMALLSAVCPHLT